MIYLYINNFNLLDKETGLNSTRPEANPHEMVPKGTLKELWFNLAKCPLFILLIDTPCSGYAVCALLEISRTLDGFYSIGPFSLHNMLIIDTRVNLWLWLVCHHFAQMVISIRQHVSSFLTLFYYIKVAWGDFHIAPILIDWNNYWADCVVTNFSCFDLCN